MDWKKQPYKGLLFYFAAIVVAGIWLSVMPALGVDYYDAGMNWGFSWFFFGFAILGYWETWPFEQLKQPLQGLLVISSTLLLSVVIYLICYYVFQVTDYFIMVWTITVWCFFAILAWFTEPWFYGVEEKV